MGDSKSWSTVTESIFDCVKATSQKAHGTVYDPADGDTGTATTVVTAVGKIVLQFTLANGTLTYTILSKPWIVTEDEIWTGIDTSVTGCGG